MSLHHSLSLAAAVSWPALAMDLDQSIQQYGPPPLFYGYLLAEEVKEHFPLITQRVSSQRRFDQLNAVSHRKKMITKQGKRLQGPRKHSMYISDPRQTIFPWQDKGWLCNRQFVVVDSPVVSGSCIAFEIGSCEDDNASSPVGFMFGALDHVPNLSDDRELRKQKFGQLKNFIGFSSYDSSDRITFVPTLQNISKVMLSVVETVAADGTAHHSLELASISTLGSRHSLGSCQLVFPDDPYDQEFYPGMKDGQWWIICCLFGRGEHIEICTSM